MIRLRRPRAAASCLLMGTTLTAGCAVPFGSAAQADRAALEQAARATDPLPPRSASPPPAGDPVADNLRRGHREAEAGRPDQAARSYELVLRDDPQNAAAHHRLAVIADDRSDFAAAERHYLAALQSWPSDADLLNDLGYSYLMQNRPADAERTLRDAVAVAPRHERALTNLGLLYSRAGDSERALAVLRMSGSDEQARAKLAAMTPATPNPAATPAGGLRRDVPSAYAAAPARNNPAASMAGPGGTPPNDATRDLMLQMAQARESGVRERAALRTQSTPPDRRPPTLIEPDRLPPRVDMAAYQSPAPAYQTRAAEYATAEYPAATAHQTARPVPPSAPQAYRRDQQIPATPAGEPPLWEPSATALRAEATTGPVRQTAYQTADRSPVASAQNSRAAYAAPAPAAPAYGNTSYGDAHRTPPDLFGVAADADRFPLLNGNPNPPVPQTPYASPGSMSAVGGSGFLPPPRYTRPEEADLPSGWNQPTGSPAGYADDAYARDRRIQDAEIARLRAQLNNERLMPAGASAYSPQYGPYTPPPRPTVSPDRGAW